jgi:hypothetical protein
VLSETKNTELKKENLEKLKQMTLVTDNNRKLFASAQIVQKFLELYTSIYGNNQLTIDSIQNLNTNVKLSTDLKTSTPQFNCSYLDTATGKWVPCSAENMLKFLMTPVSVHKS